jgi:hypothetical protein
MNPYFFMLLEWARSGRDSHKFTAHGYLLRDQNDTEHSRLDPVEAAHVRNVLRARMAGVSA